MSDSQASQKSARSTAAKAVTDLSRGSPGFWRSLAFLLAATAVLVGTMVIDPNLTLGSGLVDQSQKMTVAARATAEKKAVGQRS